MRATLLPPWEGDAICGEMGQGELRRFSWDYSEGGVYYLDIQSGNCSELAQFGRNCSTDSLVLSSDSGTLYAAESERGVWRLCFDIRANHSLDPVCISREARPGSSHLIRYAIFRTFEKAVLRLESGFGDEPLSRPEDCHDYCSGDDDRNKRRGRDGSDGGAGR